MENIFKAELVHEEHNEELIQKFHNEKKTFNHAYVEEITSSTLAAYGDICSILKNPQRGLNALHFCRNRSNKIKSKSIIIKNVNVYNSLLKGFAQKGDITKIKEILNFMKESGVSLNIQSHIYVLECLGKINCENNFENDIKTYVQEIFKNNINFDQIMNQGTFYNGQRNLVLLAMKAFNPDYKPTYFKPDIQYDNHLVDYLNSENQELKDDRFYNDRDGIFMADGVIEATRKQIELEKSGYVTVS